MEKAFDGLGEVILAYEMNGEDLPRDHGYPVSSLVGLLRNMSPALLIHVSKLPCR